MTDWSLGLEGFTGESAPAEDLVIELQDLDTGQKNRVTHWSEYRITQDIFSPADTFDCTMAAIESQRQFTASGGQKAQVFAYGALQITAIVDERSEATNTTDTDLNIAGRGVGGLLIDSAVPSNLLSLANLTLSQAVQKITEPWQPDWISGVSTNAAGSRYIVSGAVTGGSKARYKRTLVIGPLGTPVIGPDGLPLAQLQKIPAKAGKRSHKAFGKNSPYYRGTDTDQLRQTKINPGDKAWDVIDRLAKQIGAHAWVGADGAVIIARPQYDFDASAYGEGIQLRWDKPSGRATGGNVAEVKLETSIAERHSETIAWGSGKSRKNAAGKTIHSKTISVKDPSPAFWKRQATAPYVGDNKIYKPNLVSVKNVQDRKLVTRMIRGQVERKIVDAFSLEYELPGHFAPTGVLWTTDSMVNVKDDRNGIEDAFYVTAVERKYSMDKGKSTLLRLIPPKIWLYLDHDSTGDDAWLKHMTQRVWW